MEPVLAITIYGEPRSKKNSMRIVKMGNRYSLVQNERYRNYERDAVSQIEGAHQNANISYHCNIKYTFYRSTRRRVDLSNLISAADDILVKANVIEDDNFKIVGGHDGSRIRFDPAAPRTEILITPLGIDQ